MTVCITPQILDLLVGGFVRILTIALKDLFHEWNMVTSPPNRSGWLLGKLCLARLATSCWLLSVKVSKGMPENVSLGIECSAGCLAENPEGCG